MLPAGLSMLWEDVDAVRALRQRFGMQDRADVDAWLSATLVEVWGVGVRSVTRVVISDHNAVVWVESDRGPLIAKLTSRTSTFAHLHDVAGLLSGVAAAGIATAAPVPARDGSHRVVVRHAGTALSLMLQPEIGGEHLDVENLDAVRATGAEVARLHHVLATLPVDGLLVPARGDGAPLRSRLERALSHPTLARFPAPGARLAALTRSLPDLDRPPQLVHGDIRSANVLTTGSRVSALLDFDEVGLDDPLAELARARVLLATRFRDWAPTPAAARDAFIQGYREIHPLNELESGWLDALTLAAAVAMVPDGDDPSGWAASLADMV